MTIITRNIKQSTADNLLSVCDVKETDTAGRLVCGGTSSISHLRLFSAAPPSATFRAAALQTSN